MENALEAKSKFTGRPNDRERSRDGLDEYIHVSSTGILLTTLALLIALAGFVIWGFYGTLPVKAEAVGAVVHLEDISVKIRNPENTGEDGVVLPEDFIICFLNAEDYSLDDFDNVSEDVVIEMPDHGRFPGKILGMLPMPVAQDVIQNVIDIKWVSEKAVVYDFSWVFYMTADLDYHNYSYMIPRVTITLDEVRPISYLTRQGAGK